MRIIFIAVFVIVSIQFASAQKLKARVDQLLHASNVTEMIISPDRKHFATSDNSGVVVMRDIKTGKVIAHHEFQGEISDIFYAKEKGHIIAVYHKNNFDADGKHTIEVFDFIDQKTIHQKVFDTQFSDIELDFSPKDDIIVLTFNNTMITYNIKTLKTELNEFELPFLIAGFAENNIIEIINYGGDWRGGKHYSYNYKTKSLSPTPEKKHEAAYLEFDMNNKHMFRKNNAMTFTDNLIGISVSIPENLFYYKDGRMVGMEGPQATTSLLKKITIEDFAFSSDRKHLAIVGGEDPEDEEEAMFEQSYGDGFVALYSIEQSKLIWKTEAKPQQTKHMTNDLDWIDLENFVTSDAYGNTIFYNITSSNYSRAYYLPQRYGASANITPTFDSITYTLVNNGGFKFSCINPENAKGISEEQLNKIDAGSFNWDNVNAFDKTFENINSALANLNEPNNNSEENNDHVSIHKSETSKNKKYSAAEVYISKSIQVEKILYNDKKQAIGFTNNGYKFIHINQKYTKGQYISLDDVDFLIVLTNMENYSDCTFLISDEYESYQFSNNSKYISLNGNNSFTYNIEQQKIEGLIDDKNTRTIFDENTDIALSYDNSHNLTFWNSATDEIYKKINLNTIYDHLEDATEFFSNYISRIQVDEANKLVYFSFDQQLHSFNFKTKAIELIYEDEYFFYFNFSPDFKYLNTNYYTENFGLRVSLKNFKTNKTIYSENIVIAKSDEIDFSKMEYPAFFHSEKPLAFIPDTYGEFRLLNLEKEEQLANLKFFKNGEWLVYTPSGVFDGSKEGRKKLYYLSGTEVILYDQLKETYWESDLLNKLINNPDLVQSTSLSQKIDDLQPDAKLELIDGDGKIKITLIPRGGGIGRVSLFINGKEIIEDINKERKSEIFLNLLDFRDRLYTAGLNTVGIKTYNKEGWLHSRIIQENIDANIDGEKGTNNDEKKLFARSSRRSTKAKTKNKPGLFGLFVGTSKYQDKSISLDYADKDAKVLTEAFQKISKNMYNPSRINLVSLTTDTNDPKKISSRVNITKALDSIANHAKPNDIIILYFSGHGLTISDDFYYLTSTAGNVDLTKNEKKRKESCISSTEINKALKKITSNKQILILDACHSGKIAKLANKKSKAISTTQEKALEKLEDKTGVYILASSEAEQKSYEAKALTHGLLTFSLLRGMSGEATNDDIINVIDLLSYASKEAENIGRNELGGGQRPVLGISDGGNSFPIGFKNTSLKIELPKNKIKFGRPNFVSLPLINDPRKLTDKMLAKIKELGPIGTKEPFIYSNNNDKDTYMFTGSYEVIKNEVILNWNLLKDNKKYKGPFTEKMDGGNVKKFTENIINKAVEIILE